MLNVSGKERSFWEPYLLPFYCCFVLFGGMCSNEYPCGICKKEVGDEDKAIHCEGKCQYWYHCTCLEALMTMNMIIFQRLKGNGSSGVLRTGLIDLRYTENARKSL